MIADDPDLAWPIEIPRPLSNFIGFI